MKKYDALRAHGNPRQILPFDEIGAILDQKYGYEVEKISLKARTVTFVGKGK